jgi:hypothetical protein
VRERRTLVLLGLILTLAPAACGQAIPGDAVAARGLAAPVSTTKTPTTTSTSRPTTSAPATSARPSDVLAGLAGTWAGEYTCAQGNTGLRLTIKEPSGDALPATFEFFPLPANPAAKKGSYSMLGGLSPAGQLVFRQQQWIDQPAGYVMVDLAVTSPLDADAAQLSGDVLEASCKGFSVRRR